MLWWFEWLDQGSHFAPYRAISAFIAGEDLRSPNGSSVVLKVSSVAGQLWARAWKKPGRMLGYLLDEEWGRSGNTSVTHAGVALNIGDNIKAGQIQIEWWDADEGAWHQSIIIDHAGGPLQLKPPSFLRHIAFKMVRLETKLVPTPAEIK
jgi:hypothetical protein